MFGLVLMVVGSGGRGCGRVARDQIMQARPNRMVARLVLRLGGGVGSIGELAVAGVVRATPIASVVAKLGKFIVWGRSVGTHVVACAGGCTNGVGVQVAGVWCAWLGECACGC